MLLEDLLEFYYSIDQGNTQLQKGWPLQAELKRKGMRAEHTHLGSYRTFLKAASYPLLPPPLKALSVAICFRLQGETEGCRGVCGLVNPIGEYLGSFLLPAGITPYEEESEGRLAARREACSE